jgi:hypothetical protein
MSDGKKSTNNKMDGFISFTIFILFVFAAVFPFSLAQWSPQTLKDHPMYAGIPTIISLAFACVLLGGKFLGCRQGILVDRRNMMSLSKLQILIWTLLAVSGFITLAALKMANNIQNPLDVGIPETVWAVMGISTASFVGSPFLKNDNMKGDIKNDKGKPLDEEKKKLVLIDLNKDKEEDSGKKEARGSEVVNKYPWQANFSDLFRGEEIGNSEMPDLGKIQMFLFTIITSIAYAALIYNLIKMIPEKTPEIIALQHSPVITTNATLQLQLQGKISDAYDLPDISAGIAALLGISNAGYLASKSVPREVAPKSTEQEST